MAGPRALDTTIAIVTPENIQFDYQLAGPFRRLPAFLVDMVVLGLVYLTFWVCMFFLGLTLASFGMTGTGPGGLDFLILVVLVVNFLLYFFYSATLETLFNGRTVGKWMCGIRTLCADGRPITAWRAWMRNLLRVADLMPLGALPLLEGQAPAYVIPTGMIGLVAIVLSPKMQRFGDLVSGTMVVVDERSWRLPVVRVDDARVPALASYIPGDYRVTRSMAKALATYAERRAYLNPGRRREVARHLAIPLIEQFEFRDDIDPDLLLYALYYKTFLVESSADDPHLGQLAGVSPLKRDMPKESAQAEMGGKGTLSFGTVPAPPQKSYQALAGRRPLKSSVPMVNRPESSRPPMKNAGNQSGGIKISMSDLDEHSPQQDSERITIRSEDLQPPPPEGT